MLSWKERIARNKAYVAARRAETVCAQCSGQPIEWHAEHHHKQPLARIGVMAHHPNAIKTIEAEIARCIPLCRRCHMTEDGRLQRLVEASEETRWLSEPPKPCQQCARLYKPLRRGLCARCYDRTYRPNRNPKKEK